MNIVIKPISINNIEIIDNIRIFPIYIEFNKSATFRVCIGSEIQDIKIEDEEYKEWGQDDNYIINLILKTKF